MSDEVTPEPTEPDAGPGDDAYDQDEEELVAERLRALGYIE